VWGVVGEDFVQDSVATLLQHAMTQGACLGHTSVPFLHTGLTLSPELISG
jgi:hypothetical protein